MKKIVIVLGLALAFGVPLKSEAQVLKGFGRKLEKKIEERIDRKADRNVDKVLDKADRATDKPIDDAINKPSGKKDKKEKEPKKADKSKEARAESREQSSESGSSSSVSTPNVVSLSEGLVMMPGGSCSDFIWFKPGAMMEFETKDGSGKSINKSKMEIAKVYDEGQVTVADAIASDNEGNNFDMQFKCAGDRIYMDFGSLIKQAMQQAGQDGANNADVQRALENTEIGFSDGFMDFPKSMYPGQTLEDVSVSITTSPTPQVSIEMISMLTDRKVVAKERVTTSAGSFDCMKISGVRETSMKVMGMNRKMPAFTEYIWFAPGIGVVKQEDIDEKGKLGASMQLTAYKL